MSDDTEDTDDLEHIEKIGGEVVGAFGADTVVVTLSNGGKITGSIVGFTMRKKTGKKGAKAKPPSYTGNVSVQTDPGVLDIDCLTIASVSAGTG
jgi:hypothetical protein